MNDTLSPPVRFRAPRRTRLALGLCISLTLMVNAGCIETDPPVTTGDMSVDVGETGTPEEMGGGEANTRPVAAPGSSREVQLGESVVLDGSGSFDGDGDALTFSWSLARPQSSDAMLMDAQMAVANFLPDVAGEYQVELVVNDGTIDSLPANLTITVVGEDLNNTPPVADAGVNRQVKLGEAVTLDGSNSVDPEGDTLSFAWSLVGAPAGSSATIADQEAAIASITPDVEGMYQIRLIVNDGMLGSNPALLTLIAVQETPENQAPVARQSGDQNAEVGELVTLDGTMSQDPDGQSVTYSWMLVKPSGSNSFLSAPTASRPTFTPDVEGTYTATLTVSDGMLSSAPVATTITASLGNQAPTARVGMARSVLTGQRVMLDGDSSSDPEGTSLTFNWTLTDKPSGSGATIQNATSATPEFTPDLVGTYVAELIVSDGALQSMPTSVLITAVAPCMLISEYIEGSSNNKALEFYNCSGTTLPLDMIRVCLFSNANTTCDDARPFTLSELPDGGVTVLCNGQADLPGITAACGGNTSSVANFNGNDRLVLFVDLDGDGAFSKGSDTVLDAFGQYEVDPGAGAWADVTYERCSATSYQGVSAFDPAQYFSSEPSNTTSNLGVAPALAGCP